MLDDLVAPTPTAGKLPNLNFLPLLHELNLGARQQTELLADLLGDRDLALAGDLGHKVRVALVLLLLRRAGLRMRAVPVERFAQAVGELDPRAPAGQLAQLGRVDVLAVDLAVGRARAKVFGLDAGAGSVRDQVDDLAHRVRALATGVESLAPGLASVECPLDRQIGGDGVVDVEE